MEKPIPIRQGIHVSMHNQLLQDVSDHPQDEETLDRYYRYAVAHLEIDAAKAAIFDLQKQYPWNHQLRRRYIALCLYQQDFPNAMDAIETLVAFSTPDDALIDSALAVRSALGLRSLTVRPHNEPSIALCMIVKNELNFLGPCLNSVKNLVDEIIVIDTGSTDRSADIARIYGAQVHNVEWCDDFSAARNHALGKAHGEWILILDADEVIAPQDHAAVRGLVSNDPKRPIAYAFTTRNYTNHTNALDWQANDGRYCRQEACNGWFPTNKVRLFPRADNIRFRYPVHELVDVAIREAGMKILNCPIPIHHYGNVNETKNSQKARNYFDLGYAKLEQLGNDPVALRELAVQAGQLERWTHAIDLWQRLLSISPDFGEAHANLAGAYWQLGDYKQGLIYSRSAVRIDPDLKEAHYNLAVNLMLNRQLQQASSILQNLVHRYPSYLAAEFMLGVVLGLIGDGQQSRSIFKSVEKKTSRQTVRIAIDDFIQKIATGDMADRVPSLVNAVGIDLGKKNDTE